MESDTLNILGKLRKINYLGVKIDLKISEGKSSENKDRDVHFNSKEKVTGEEKDKLVWRQESNAERITSPE